LVVPGTGITESSLSAQEPSAGTLTLLFCPVPVPVPVPVLAPPVGGSVGWGRASLPGDWVCRSPGAGSEGPLLPGTPSTNDGSGDSGPELGSWVDADVWPWPFFGSFLSSPPVQETNSTMMPSSTAPSTTARRRQ
jgi:hypothetical protein